MRESAIERDSRRLVVDAGGYLLKWVSPGTTGIPDRILLLPDAVGFIEFKQPGKPLDPLQEVWRDRITALGLRHWRVDSVAQMKEIIDELTASTAPLSGQRRR